MFCTEDVKEAMPHIDYTLTEDDSAFILVERVLTVVVEDKKEWLNIHVLFKNYLNEDLDISTDDMLAAYSLDSCAKLLLVWLEDFCGVYKK